MLQFNIHQLMKVKLSKRYVICHWVCRLKTLKLSVRIAFKKSSHVISSWLQVTVHIVYSVTIRFVVVIGSHCISIFLINFMCPQCVVLVYTLISALSEMQEKQKTSLDRCAVSAAKQTSPFIRQNASEWAWNVQSHYQVSNTAALLFLSQCTVLACHL